MATACVRSGRYRQERSPTRLPTTQWRAETSPGKVTLTVTADDGRGGTASDTVTIEVIALRVLADVQFALDSAVLRPDALRTLTVALKTLNESPSITLHIEGYASPEGSPAYNKALGERRARAVRDYPDEPWDRRVATDDHELWGGAPEVDSSQDATLALNRRAAFIDNTINEDHEDHEARRHEGHEKRGGRHRCPPFYCECIMTRSRTPALPMRPHRRFIYLFALAIAGHLWP